MPVIFGRSIGAWLISIVLAILAFMLIMWLLPLLFAAISFPIPEQIVKVIAILVALVVLFGGYWWKPGTPGTPPVA